MRIEEVNGGLMLNFDSEGEFSSYENAADALDPDGSVSVKGRDIPLLMLWKKVLVSWEPDSLSSFIVPCIKAGPIGWPEDRDDLSVAMRAIYAGA